MQVRPTFGASGATSSFWKAASVMLIPTLYLSSTSATCDDGTSYPPEWSLMPAVSVPSGSNATLDLDDYITDGDNSDSELDMEVTGGSSTSILAGIDATSHVITFSAKTGFSGSVTFSLVAVDPDGNRSSTTVVASATTSTPSSIGFTSLTDGSSYSNPVTFKSAGSSDIVKAAYTTTWNGQVYDLGNSTDVGSQFPVTYSFSTTGSRIVTVDGYATSGQKVASKSITITVTSSGGASSLTITSPTEGGDYKTSISLMASGSSDVTKVKYYSTWNGENYLLGESTDAAQKFPVSYTFSNAGERTVLADGYNAGGTKVASDTVTFNVTGDSSGGGDTTEGGLGVWLWYIEGTGYTHAQLADKLKGIGVKRIYVKVADGTDIWPEANDASIPSTYQSRGIQTYGWSYNYPGNDSSQAAALTAIAKSGYDGYVLDLEIEFDGQTTKLENLLKAFSSARSSAISSGYIQSGWPLNATTWGNPKDHGMRVDIIDRYVDAHQPQTYLEVWGAQYMADPQYWVDYGTAEYRSMGATKPIHHIVSSEMDVITTAQLNEFFVASGCESSIWRVPGGGTPTSIWNDWAAVDWDMCGANASVVTWVSPVAGGSYKNPVTLKVTGTTDVKKVKYYADGFYLGESTNAAGNYPVTYTFSTTGSRTVVANGYDASNALIGNASISFTVADTSGAMVNGVPYYFQYNNAINPSGSCQNTSIAMVLNFYGCKVTPDAISNEWGTSYAQSPSGLATVFNSYASKCGIPQRDYAHTDGTLEDINALLKAGKPVIVHGYFTSYGHVSPIVGYDSTSYYMNDSAGKWTQQFKGGYYASDSDDGKYIKYGKDPVYAAIATSNGYTFYPIWYHEIR